VVVLACGTALRGDDAVARAALRGLPADVRRRTSIQDVGALGPEHLLALPRGARVVIVDAVVGVPPGRIVEIDLAVLDAQRAPTFVASSHRMPLDQVVVLAQVMRDEPVAGTFVGVGIESVAVGTGLSASVRGALPALREAVCRAVAAEAAEAIGQRDRRA